MTLKIDPDMLVDIEHCVAEMLLELSDEELDLLANGCNFGTVVGPPKRMRESWTARAISLSEKGLTRGSSFSSETDPETGIQTISGKLNMSPIGQVISVHLAKARQS